jgi:microcystin-dependent protein
MPWQTPDGLPTQRRYKRLRVPVIETPEVENRYVYGAMVGALYELTLPENWEANGFVTPDEIAAIFYIVFQEFNMSFAPIGAVMMWLTNSPPVDWLICDGSEVDRATYADLFALVGTQFGAGNGTTTFNLPNLKAKFPVGRDAANGRFDAIGETGGQEAVSHAHTLNNGTSRTSRLVVASTDVGWNASDANGIMKPHSSGGAATLYDIGKLMTSQEVVTLPPYVVVNFVICASMS